VLWIVVLERLSYLSISGMGHYQFLIRFRWNRYLLRGSTLAVVTNSDPSFFQRFHSSPDHG